MLRRISGIRRYGFEANRPDDGEALKKITPFS